jgi:hypothetical protein
MNNFVMLLVQLSLSTGFRENEDRVKDLTFPIILGHSGMSY